MSGVKGQVAEITIDARRDPVGTRRRIIEVLKRASQQPSPVKSAAEMLGVSVPTFRRLVQLLDLADMLPGSGAHNRKSSIPPKGD